MGLDPQCRLLLEHVWAAMQVGSVGGRSQVTHCTPRACVPLLCFDEEPLDAPLLQDAAPALGGTSHTSVGTYVGCVWSEYQVLQVGHPRVCQTAGQTGTACMHGPLPLLRVGLLALQKDWLLWYSSWSGLRNLPASLQDQQQLAPSVASLTGSGLNFLVGRVSYTFGFQGGLVWEHARHASPPSVRSLCRAAL